MTINPSIFKGYDIRGIYPADLNEENIVPIIQAIFTFLKAKTIVVGTDMRISSPALTKVAIKTLVEIGANVIDIGIISTPTFYFSVNRYKYEAGIQITASHNPKEWNGIKIVRNTNSGLVKIGKANGLEEIKAIALSGKSVTKSGNGTITKRSEVLQDEIANALTIANNPQIKPFKIVADAANAMGSQYIDGLFKKIPGDLIRMNFKLDGTFPAHLADPLKTETLVDLQKKVVEEKADIGLAPDGDGDRLFFIDEKGQVIPPTVITSIVAKELLEKNPGETILADIRYIFTPQKTVQELGGTLVVTKVGHALITEAMHQTGAIFAGESSAHFYFRDTGGAESPLAVILIVLNRLTKEGKPISQIVNELMRSYESGEFNFEVVNPQEILEAVKNNYKDGKLSTLDGVAISYPDWRFSLRISNTESLIRLNVESYKKELMEQKKGELINLIQNIGILNS